MKLFITVLLSCVALVVISAQEELPLDKLMLELRDSMVLAMQSQDRKILNKQLPNFSLTTIERDTISAAELEGKPSVIFLWDLYCQPCLDQMEILNAIKIKYKDKLNYISITKHARHEVLRFLSQDKLNFTHLVNAKEYLDHELYFSTIPKILILDKSNIVEQVIGVQHLRECCSDGLSETEEEYFVKLIDSVLTI